MVKVVLAFQSFGLLFWSENPVETVLAYDSDLPLVMIHLILTQQLHDFCTHCGLTGEKQQLLSWTDNLVVSIYNCISLNIITDAVTSGHYVYHYISLSVITFCMLFLHAFHLNANMHYIQYLRHNRGMVCMH